MHLSSSHNTWIHPVTFQSDPRTNSWRSPREDEPAQKLWLARMCLEPLLLTRNARKNEGSQQIQHFSHHSRVELSVVQFFPTIGPFGCRLDPTSVFRFFSSAREVSKSPTSSASPLKKDQWITWPQRASSGIGRPEYPEFKTKMQQQQQQHGENDMWSSAVQLFGPGKPRNRTWRHISQQHLQVVGGSQTSTKNCPALTNDLTSFL